MDSLVGLENNISQFMNSLQEVLYIISYIILEFVLPALIFFIKENYLYLIIVYRFYI